MSKQTTKKTAPRAKNPILDYPDSLISFSAFDLKESKIKKSETKQHGVEVHFLLAPDTDDSKKKKPSALVAEFPFFKANPSEIVKGPDHWYVGLGSEKKLTTDVLGEALRVCAKALSVSFAEVTLFLDVNIYNKIDESLCARLLATAFETAAFNTDFLKAKPSSENVLIKKVRACAPQRGGEAGRKFWEKELQTAGLIARHMNGMRQLQSLPGNYANPEQIEGRVKMMAKKFGLKIKVFQKADLEKMGAGGILAVGQGSVVPPRMITLEYVPKNVKKSKKLALVGKGVTFDTGGISLKPGSAMHEMKYDMSGAAAVIHAICALSELKAPVHVCAAIGLAENMPDGRAIKPGDVYTAYNGKTVEVQNTDAEGRLVLGDVLSYVDQHFKPDTMINLATLTGACLVALGHYYAGLFTRHPELQTALNQASQGSGEPLWPLPIGPLYLAQLKSDIADINNIGDRYGGSSSAASFLGEFVNEDTPWAHIDIAGTAWMKKSFNVYPSEATGFGVRLLTEFAQGFE